MFATSRRLLARIGRWPRRIAALICLLLAAGSALAPARPGGSQPTSHGMGERLHAGEVAVPVSVRTAQNVASGDLVGLLVSPEQPTGEAVLVADRLRVLSVTAPGSGITDDSNAVVVVATDRAHAVAVARYGSAPMMLIVDDSRH